MACAEITDDIRLEIECLLADNHTCDLREIRRRYFGSRIKSKCPHCDALRREFERYLASIENKKYWQEYPNG